MCFALPFFCADCRADDPPVSPASGKAAGKPSGVDDYLRADFIAYLGSQEGNQPAAEIRGYLVSHPGLKFHVAPGRPPRGTSRYWARFDSKNSQIRISKSLVADTGYSAKSPGMSIAERDKFMAAAAPLLVRETVAAQMFADLGFEAIGTLEGELLSNAYEAWYINSDPALAKPENFEVGAELYDQLAPLASTYAGTFPKAGPAERRKLVGDVHGKIKDISRKRPGGDTFITDYSFWVAFTGSWSAFSAYVHVFNAAKGPVLAGPEQVDAHVKYMEKLKADAEKEAEGDPGPVFKELMSFWGDSDKIARAQAYFRKRLDAVSSRAGFRNPGSLFGALTPDDIAAHVFLGQAYPSGNVYLSPFPPPDGDVGQVSWPDTVNYQALFKSRSGTGKIREARFSRAMHDGLEGDVIKSAYIPALESMDDRHEGCSKKFYKPKISRYKYLSEDFFYQVLFSCDSNEGVAVYKNNGISDVSFAVVAFEKPVQLVGTAWLHGQNRPLSAEEAAQVAKEKAEAGKNDADCTTSPQFLDAAVSYFSAKIKGSDLSIRISQYENPGCGGHLAKIYVLDVLQSGVLLKKYELVHYAGGI